jgi:hypothetical protein
VRIRRSEALDVFRKWFSEQALLRCYLSFPKFAATLRGRIFAMSELEIKIVSDDRSDDRRSEIVLRVSDDLEFGYGDPRTFPEDAARYESILVVFFGPIPQTGDADMIAFSEIKSANA